MERLKRLFWGAVDALDRFYEERTWCSHGRDLAAACSSCRTLDRELRRA